MAVVENVMVLWVDYRHSVFLVGRRASGAVVATYVEICGSMD